MTYFAWDPALETGCEQIDAQHHGLFDLANALETAIEGQLDDDAIANAVFGLVDYVIEHFADEEAMMAEYGYPGLVPHRSLHEQLSGQTLEVLARYSNGELDASSQLAPLVCDWLSGHIRGQDMNVVAHVEATRRARAEAARI